MQNTFQTIGLIGRHSNPETLHTLQELIQFLQSRQKKIILDTETAHHLGDKTLPQVMREQLGSQCDLIIVIGGDGSLLHAARAIVDSGTPILGINRGRLGFLTDIKPNELTTKLDAILKGHYTEEPRFLLETQIKKQSLVPSCALNDIVLSTGDAPHMIEFEVYVNDVFMCSERSDGMIIATPTGSTAYALSGGGPIIHPALNAIVIVPMFSHTLNSRPIVIPGDSTIRITMSKKAMEMSAHLALDGEKYASIVPNEHIVICKKKKPLLLIHPKDYDYFENVRSKLYWGQQLSRV